MKTIDKNLIRSLIKDDLLNYKLVAGLQNLGIDASAYCLHLSESIFYLAEIDELTDAEIRKEKYFELSKKVMRLKTEEELEELVGEVMITIGL